LGVDAARHDREPLEQQVRREVAGEVGMVERRADLDQVHADQANARQTAEQVQGLSRGEPAWDRRAGPDAVA
jgi:hypothetical protein